MQHLYAHSCMCVKRHLDTNDMCLFLESVVCRFTCAKGVFRPSWHDVSETIVNALGLEKWFGEKVVGVEC